MVVLLLKGIKLIISNSLTIYMPYKSKLRRFLRIIKLSQSDVLSNISYPKMILGLIKMTLQAIIC